MKERRYFLFLILFFLAIVNLPPMVSLTWAKTSTWSQTTQTEFETGVLSQIDTITNPGNVALNPPDNTTIVLLHFDEGSGTPRDSSNKNQTVTLTGASNWTEGKFNNAFKFGLSNSYVQITDSTSFDGLYNGSVEFWIKPSSFPSAGTRLALSKNQGGSNNGDMFLLILSTRLLRLQLDEGTGLTNYDNTTTLTVDKWDHIAFVWERGASNTTFTWYINGNAETGTGTRTKSNTITPFASVDNLLIGGAATSLDSVIDEFCLTSIYHTSFSTSGGYYSSGSITSSKINSGEPITNIRLDWEDTRPAGTSITYSATNDGGVHWFELPGDKVLFTFPGAGNDLRVKAELRTGSGTPTLDSWSAEFSGDPYGAVYDAITGQAIAGAQVILHTPDGSIYSGTPQDNPQITDALGKYNFYAEKGKYYITATVQGYRDYTSSIFTQDGGQVMVNVNMEPLDFVAQNGLLISQTANKTTAKRGDIITYFFKVKNTNSSSISSPEISVKLPYNFKYIKDSALRDGVKSTDPKDTSGRLIFSPDNIGVNTSITYSYRVRVGIDAYEGKNISEGKVNYTSGQVISTGPVYAVVYIKSLFSPKGLVVGKVFEDTNANGIQDIGESPIPYVAIISEDGRVVLSDENGQYSIIGFNYDTHVLKLDQRVMPGGPLAIAGLTTSKNFPKDIPPISKTIDIPKSGLAKVNFPITPEERARYREANKLIMASWEKRLSGSSQEDKEVKETQAQKEILTGYYNKGVSLYAKGKYNEAISEFKKIDKSYKEIKDSIQPILSKKL